MCSWAGREYLAKSVITKSGSASEASKDFCGGGAGHQSLEMPRITPHPPTPTTLTKLIFLGTLT